MGNSAPPSTFKVNQTYLEKEDPHFIYYKVTKVDRKKKISQMSLEEKIDFRRKNQKTKRSLVKIDVKLYNYNTDEIMYKTYDVPIHEDKEGNEYCIILSGGPRIINSKDFELEPPETYFLNFT
jgi:hypothetical protein